MLCSLSECRKDVLGTCVVVSPLDVETDLSDSGMLVYEGLNEGIRTQWVTLHPNCFTDVVTEITRQEGSSALNVFIGSVADLRVALEIA